MLIYNRGDKYIRITIPEMECDNFSNDTNTILYIIKSPEVVCNNKEDAEYIREKINSFTISLVRERLDGKETKDE